MFATKKKKLFAKLYVLTHIVTNDMFLLLLLLSSLLFILLWLLQGVVIHFSMFWSYDNLNKYSKIS